ncbi:hypothetical protein LTR53_001236 [Teratosphaeriaceae sp. CCFEE 6253]|nr:hypothetical protein LTR53_001236 [Teratosphaeriaceae sp. CCFEE 6253]
MSAAYTEESDAYRQYFEASGSDEDTIHSAVRREELRTTLLVNLEVKCAVEEESGDSLFPQYALLGKHVGGCDDIPVAEPILLNTNAPQSAFICGSQGSGKSYTLSCMLENCLRPDHTLGKLIKPLTGVVFHYDRNGASAVAEAASLCSMGIKVRVLVSRSWYRQRAASYHAVPGSTPENMEVLPLLFQDHHLEADRILKLMAFSDSENGMPLYMNVLMRILRDTAVNNRKLELAGLERQLVAESFSPG